MITSNLTLIYSIARKLEGAAVAAPYMDWPVVILPIECKIRNPSPWPVDITDVNNHINGCLNQVVRI